MRKPHTLRFPALSLRALHAFEVTARTGSASGAARELCVTQGAVSRQVSALEDALGSPLFQRQGGALRLTARAERFAIALTRIFDDMQSATAEFLSDRDSASVTVRGYLSFLNRWLLPRLPAFVQARPDVQIRMLGSSGASNVDFNKDRADVGVRYGRGAWRGLESHMLLPDDLVVVCAPSVASTLASANPRDLSHLKLLQSRSRMRDWPDWLKATGLDARDDQFVTFEDFGVVVQCALSGQGAALVQRAYVAEELAHGQLVAPFRDGLQRTLGYHLVYPNDRPLSSEASAFRDWLIDVASSTGRGER